MTNNGKKTNVTQKKVTNSKSKTDAVKTKTTKTAKEEVVEVKAEEVKKTKVEETFENDKKSVSIIKRIWNVVFWVAFFILLFIWVFDFVKVVNEKEPVFCIKHVEHKFDDGKVDECVGLGYKVYSYNRKSVSTKKQFTPFFVGMKEE